MKQIVHGKALLMTVFLTAAVTMLPGSSAFTADDDENRVGRIRLENAASVYQEILASINQEEEIQFNRQIVSAPAARLKPKMQASKNSETEEFIDELRFEIQESVEFPEDLKGNGYQAVVVVEFDLKPDGTIKSLRAWGKEGEALSVFEDLAIEAVKKASVFFPLVPQTIDVEGMRFKIPILFQEV